MRVWSSLVASAPRGQRKETRMPLEMRLPEICSCLPIVTLTAVLHVVEFVGTHRIRVSSGAFLRAALAGAGAASASSAAAAVSVQRPFTTACQQPTAAEVPDVPLR